MLLVLSNTLVPVTILLQSTFITTLCGKATYGNRTGKVFINGREDDLTRYRRVVGFVPQDDIMLRVMTVKEILNFHAHMRLERSVPDVTKRQKVNQVIHDLGLYDIRHSIIGDETKRGVSGGMWIKFLFKKSVLKLGLGGSLLLIRQ